MKKIICKLSFCYCLSLACIGYATAFGQAGKDALPVSSPDIEIKVNALLAKMTLEEKIGQLSQSNAEGIATGPQNKAESFTNLIAQGKLGSILNIAGVSEIRAYQKIAITKSRLKIPLLFAYDVIHGYKTIFPIPLAESCSWDLEAMKESAKIAAIESSAAGLHWTFAPMVDIARDPRWGRVSEGAGEDTWLACKIAKSRVQGFQWNIGENNSVLSCVKHFAAYGLPQAGKDYGPVDMSERTLEEIYLPPFKAGVDAGAATFMTAFNELNGVPCTANQWLINDVLRNRWHFNGFVVSDWAAIEQLVPQGVATDEKQATELALHAGVDMDMQDGLYNSHTIQLIKEGRINEKQINEMVKRILRVKFALGLFDDPFRFCDEKREKETIMRHDFLGKAREIGQKSIVLLKNENQVLPISKNHKSIAVIGPLTNTKEGIRDFWAGKGDAKDYVSLLEGIESKLGKDIAVNYAKGCEIEGNDKSGFEAAINIAKKSEIIIVAIGEKALMSGEDASRSFIGIPGVQEDLVKELLATGKPLAVVLMNGRPLTIPWLAENAPAIVETWYLGSQTGHAIADVLFGDYNPSGKLTMSFPRTAGQIPVYYNYKESGRPGNDSLEKWTNRFIDMKASPLFAFGHGLSYTTFSYSAPQIDKPVFKENETVKISVNVKNTGNRDGEEVVQLYVRDITGSVTRPVKELKGFEKVFLKTGEDVTVTFHISSDDLAFYGHNMQYAAEPGNFVFMTGGSSDRVQSVHALMIE